MTFCLPVAIRANLMEASTASAPEFLRGETEEISESSVQGLQAKRVA